MQTIASSANMMTAGVFIDKPSLDRTLSEDSSFLEMISKSSSSKMEDDEEALAVLTQDGDGYDEDGRDDDNEDTLCGFGSWLEDTKWGDHNTTVNYFQYPSAIVYTIIQGANLWMALYVLTILHTTSTICFHSWVGVWMLSTLGVLSAVINKYVYGGVLVLSAMAHNLSELMLGLYSVDALDLQHHKKLALLIFSMVFIAQIHLILHRKSMDVQVSLTIVIGDAMYGCSGRHSAQAELKCVDWKKGEVNWAQRGLSRSSLTYVDGHFVVLGEQGRLLLIKADSNEFSPVTEYTPGSGDNGVQFKSPCWAAPIVANGLLYVRGKDQLACFQLINDSP